MSFSEWCFFTAYKVCYFKSGFYLFHLRNVIYWTIKNCAFLPFPLERHLGFSSQKKKWDIFSNMITWRYVKNKKMHTRDWFTSFLEIWFIEPLPFVYRSHSGFSSSVPNAIQFNDAVYVSLFHWILMLYQKRKTSIIDNFLKISRGCLTTKPTTAIK